MNNHLSYLDFVTFLKLFSETEGDIFFLLLKKSDPNMEKIENTTVLICQWCRDKDE